MFFLSTVHYRCHFVSSRNNPVKLSVQYVHGCRKCPKILYVDIKKWLIEIETKKSAIRLVFKFLFLYFGKYYKNLCWFLFHSLSFCYFLSQETKDRQLLPPRPPLVLPADPAGFGKNLCKGNSLAGSM